VTRRRAAAPCAKALLALAKEGNQTELVGRELGDAAGFAADRLKRIRELEAREGQLCVSLSAGYIDRIRTGETQLRELALEVTALRGRLEARFTIRAVLPDPECVDAWR